METVKYCGGSVCWSVGCCRYFSTYSTCWLCVCTCVHNPNGCTYNTLVSMYLVLHILFMLLTAICQELRELHQGCIVSQVNWKISWLDIQLHIYLESWSLQCLNRTYVRVREETVNSKQGVLRAERIYYTRRWGINCKIGNGNVFTVLIKAHTLYARGELINLID